MTDILTAQGVIGHNQPSDPFTLFAESIEDLLLEANNYLDGEPIETEEQEQAVASILTRLRREANGADDARKAEKKPFDEQAKAVQAKWTPLLTKADLAVTAAKEALSAFLRKKEDAQRAAAEAAIEEARRQADAAAQAMQNTRPDDLAGLTTARVLQEAAEDARKRAERLDRAKAQAKGGERAVGLRRSYHAEITDPLAFGKWAWTHRNAEYLAFLEGLAEREARGGDKGIPGLVIHTERKAA
jgi:hypothetical protein